MLRGIECGLLQNRPQCLIFEEKWIELNWFGVDEKLVGTMFKCHNVLRIRTYDSIHLKIMNQPDIDNCSAIIFDDHSAIRIGVTQALGEKDISVVASCETSQQLGEALKLHPNAVVICDLAVDKMSLPALMEFIHSVAENAKVVVYSMRDEASTIAMCFEYGALSFIPKHGEMDDLITAVKDANNSRQFLTAYINSKLASYFVSALKSPVSQLTAREKAIFINYAKGCSTEEIVKLVGITYPSVQNALTAISKKLGVPRSKFKELAEMSELLKE